MVDDIVEVHTGGKARRSSDDGDISMENLESNSPTLLANIIDLLGTDVEVTLANKEKYKGILLGCSPEFDIGLSYAQKLPLGEEDRLCMTSANAVRKIIFPSRDVVCLTGAIHPKANHCGAGGKERNSFATDAEIGSQMKNGGSDVLFEQQQQEREFEAWEHDGDYDETLEIEGADKGLTTNSSSAGNANDGWTVEEMLKANEQKGVTTSFDPNLTDYSTAEPIGDEEDKRRAAKLAREIEKNPLSKRQAMLENDDEERDLDVETCFTHEEGQSNQQQQQPWQQRRSGGGGRGVHLRDNQRHPVGGRYGGSVGSGKSGSWRRSADTFRADGSNRYTPTATTLPTTSASDISTTKKPVHVSTIVPPTTSLGDGVGGETVRLNMPSLSASADAAEMALEENFSKFTFNPDAKPFIPAGLVAKTEGLEGIASAAISEAPTKNSSFSGGDGSGRSSAQPQPQLINQSSMSAVYASDQRPFQVVQVPVYHQQQQAQPTFLPQHPIQMAAYASHQQSMVARQYAMPPPFPTTYNPQQLPYVVYAGGPAVIATTSGCGAMEMSNSQPTYQHSAQQLQQSPPHMDQSVIAGLAGNSVGGGQMQPLTMISPNMVHQQHLMQAYQQQQHQHAINNGAGQRPVALPHDAPSSYPGRMNGQNNVNNGNGYNSARNTISSPPPSHRPTVVIAPQQMHHQPSMGQDYEQQAGQQLQHAAAPANRPDMSGGEAMNSPIQQQHFVNVQSPVPLNANLVSIPPAYFAIAQSQQQQPPPPHQGGYPQPQSAQVFQTVPIVTQMPYPMPHNPMIGAIPPPHPSREVRYGGNGGGGRGGGRRSHHEYSGGEGGGAGRSHRDRERDRHRERDRGDRERNNH